jgi:hypothetical protein
VPLRTRLYWGTINGCRSSEGSEATSGRGPPRDIGEDWDTGEDVIGWIAPSAVPCSNS